MKLNHHTIVSWIEDRLRTLRNSKAVVFVQLITLPISFRTSTMPVPSDPLEEVVVCRVARHVERAANSSSCSDSDDEGGFAGGTMVTTQFRTSFFTIHRSCSVHPNIGASPCEIHVSLVGQQSAGECGKCWREWQPMRYGLSNRRLCSELIQWTIRRYQFNFKN